MDAQPPLGPTALIPLRVRLRPHRAMQPRADISEPPRLTESPPSLDLRSHVSLIKRAPEGLPRTAHRR